MLKDSACIVSVTNSFVHFLFEQQRKREREREGGGGGGKDAVGLSWTRVNENN